MNLLPPEFIAAIHELLTLDGHPEELDAFVRAQEEPSARGLRANRLRVHARETLAALLAPHLPAPLEPVAWSSDGFYYPPEASPAGLVAYHAGLFYIQEPSAMLPAELLGACPGERIMDLCAAPGGKSCRIAADLAGEGLLWANDLSADRVRPLVRNLELMGVTNAVVTAEKPERLAAAMPRWFDRVIVDAPCSGAGMIRRDTRALASFQERGPAFYAREQAAILAAADTLLKPGGRLVYSTCTFAIEENEAQIADFLARHPDYEPEPVPLSAGLSPGLPFAGRRLGIRIWPHRTRGDGHFCAILRKRSPGGTAAGEAAAEATADARQEAGNREPLPGAPLLGGLLSGTPHAFDQFLMESLNDQGRAHLHRRMGVALRLHEGHLHGLPLHGIPAGGLHLVKTGLYLGDLRLTGPAADKSAASTAASRFELRSREGQGRRDDRSSRDNRDNRSGRNNRDSRDTRGGRDARGARSERGATGSDSGFDPSHALSHVLEPADLNHAIVYPLESRESRQYIRGETLLHPAAVPANQAPGSCGPEVSAGAVASILLNGQPMAPGDGALPPAGTLVGIAAGGFLIGFARQMPDGHLKNLYPPAWRKHS